MFLISYFRDLRNPSLILLLTMGSKFKVLLSEMIFNVQSNIVVGAS